MDAQIRAIAAINAALSAVFKKHYSYIPTPRIARYLSIDKTRVQDIAALAMHAWEICHNGVNGLRYGSYSETDELIECISREVCGANEEDLSSAAQYLQDVPHTEASLRAYWFARTFSNCSSVSLTFMTTLKALVSDISIASHDDIDFKLSTAAIKGFSLQTKGELESKSITTDLETDSTTYHQWFESHNHVIVSLESVSGQLFALDLSGAQFGQFGQNLGHPYFILEPMDEWKQRFACVYDDAAQMSYSGKNTLIRIVTTIVVKAYPLSMRCATCSKSSNDNSLQVCSRCKECLYCSAACQRIDWKNGHKHDAKNNR